MKEKMDKLDELLSSLIRHTTVKCCLEQNLAIESDLVETVEKIKSLFESAPTQMMTDLFGN